MNNQLLLVLEQQQVLSWTCVLVFIATSVITLLGIAMPKKVPIDPSFLNKLFVALILEVVAIGVLVFKDTFKPTPIVEFVKIVTPQSGIPLGQITSASVFITGAYNKSSDEVLKSEIRTNNKITALTNISNTDKIFYAYVDTSLLNKDNNSIVLISLYKENKKIVSDSITLKK